MRNDVRLSDAALDRAARDLAIAARETAVLSGAPPRQRVESLSGIGDAVAAYVRGMAVASGALADAAKTAALALAELMERSEDLDRRLAASLPSGYAVPTGGQHVRADEC